MNDIPDCVYVDPSSVQLGNVNVGDYSSLWPHSSIRGDFDAITIGRFVSVQDAVTIHASPGAPTRVGDFVTLAHNCVLHGCTVEDQCLISMGAIIQDYCVIGRGTIVAAGAVLKERTVVPPGSLVMGVPAIVKSGREGQAETARNNALAYAALAMNYQAGKETITREELVANIAKLKELAGID